MINDVTIFDFETTGLDPANDRVIEMAAIRCVNGVIVSQFQTLVKYDGVLSPRITEITGITPEALVGGLEESIAFRILKNMAQDSLLIAHNAAFDLAFYHFWLQRFAGETVSNNFIDTVAISRDRHFYPHKLTDMTERYGIKLTGAHRALNDVVGCWELLKAMHDEQPIDEWVNKLGYLRKYGPPKWTPAHAELIPMDNRYAN